MHEMSVMGEIFTIINKKVKEYKLNKITKVVVKVGEMTCINEESLKFAFKVFSENNLVEEAEFIINKVEAKAKCSNCGYVFKITYTDKLCPLCNTYSDNITNGYELYLEEVEGETDEDDSNK